jgi:hypothetical protein
MQRMGKETKRPRIKHQEAKTLTVSSDSHRVGDQSSISSLESRDTTKGELGGVFSLELLHGDLDDLEVLASEDGSGTGTGNSPVV